MAIRSILVPYGFAKDDDTIQQCLVIQWFHLVLFVPRIHNDEIHHKKCQQQPVSRSYFGSHVPPSYTYSFIFIKVFLHKTSSKTANILNIVVSDPLAARSLQSSNFQNNNTVVLDTTERDHTSNSALKINPPALRQQQEQHYHFTFINKHHPRFSNASKDINLDDYYTPKGVKDVKQYMKYLKVVSGRATLHNSDKRSILVELKKYVTQFIESVFVFGNHWFFITAIDGLMHGKPLDDAAEDGLFTLYEAPTAIIKEKSFRGQRYYEVSIFIGYLEFLLIGGFFGSMNNSGYLTFGVFSQLLIMFFLYIILDV
ncbi:hypothetical protein BDA99DRAFT_555511 [Phascolomyces articulosus]|uniref:Uncharacterized protein n=1 Tax=Phascolomyces articulosus TaxID=60185 RepID=A0AAD5KA66_9FUNG|nr:hypothetical protein BDA99DRAFT_555511 [Phascolomyces articulosus]